MNANSILSAFTEKYDHEAIDSLEELSHDFGMNANGIKIKAFNISESFSTFNAYIKGYKDYKIKNINNPKASSQEVIRESVDKVIDSQLIKECDIYYSEIPKFVKSYIDGINMLSETADNIRDELILNDITGESVSDIDTFMDRFVNKLTESFDPVMDRFLWASGYNAHQRLKPKTKDVANQPMFL